MSQSQSQFEDKSDFDFQESQCLTSSPPPSPLVVSSQRSPPPSPSVVSSQRSPPPSPSSPRSPPVVSSSSSTLLNEVKRAYSEVSGDEDDDENSDSRKKRAISLPLEKDAQSLHVIFVNQGDNPPPLTTTPLNWIKRGHAVLRVFAGMKHHWADTMLKKMQDADATPQEMANLLDIVTAVEYMLNVYNE